MLSYEEQVILFGQDVISQDVNNLVLKSAAATNCMTDGKMAYVLVRCNYVNTDSYTVNYN